MYLSYLEICPSSARESYASALSLPEIKLYDRAANPTDTHTAAKPGIKPLTAAESIVITQLTIRLFLRPMTSANIPEGISARRLTIWNTVSAIPTCISEYPSDTRSNTHAAPAIGILNRKFDI